MGGVGVPRWRVWYADGTSVSSDASTWARLHAHDLLILKVWPDDGPKAIYCGLDAIWWDGERIFQLDIPEPFMKVAKKEAQAGRLKFGRAIPDDEYEALYSEALAARE